LTARSPLGALHEALRVALRMGHNYIGTEHILLGLLAGADATAATLVGLGITADTARQHIDIQVAAIQAARRS
jgi:ATP-dependent Clp protease ATP-binding subunit ClpA